MPPTPPTPPARWFAQFFQDLRFGIRQLVKAPAFTLIAVLTIGLGIGACTSLFSIVNKLVLHPLDYRDPERLVQVSQNLLPKFRHMGTPIGAFREWQRQATVFDELAGTAWDRAKFNVGDRYLEVTALAVTQNYFATYQLQPEMGRFFQPEEMVPGKGAVAVISQQFWKSQFNGRSDILGLKIVLEDRILTVIGVVQDTQKRRVAIYTPLQVKSEEFTSTWMLPVARLKAGITLAQARAEMDVIAARIAKEHPKTNRKVGVTITPEIELWTSGLRVQLFVLLGAVGFLLLIACVNVANLLLARASTRQREIALRAALGAGRGRIVRQMLAESLLIAVTGGGVGLALAYATMRPLVAFASHVMPNTDRVAVDGMVLAVTTGLMVAAGVGFGLVPALQATRGDMMNGLKEGGQNASGGRRTRRLRASLVVAEIAFALVLLIGTGLMMRSLRAMQQFDQGIRTENVFSSGFTLNSKQRYDTPDQIVAFTHAALDRIRAVPEVDSAAFSNGIPMGNVNSVQKRAFLLEGGQIPIGVSDNILICDDYTITPDYFHVMSIPFIAGRTFDEHDSSGSNPVVVVNREMVRRHFADKNPLGQKIRVLTGPKEKEIWSEIVGVVGDVKPAGPASFTDPQVYQVFDQRPDPAVTLMLRLKHPAPAVSGIVRDIIRSLDSGIKIEGTYDYDSTIAYSWVRQRFNLILFSLFSALALVLSAIGIFGVMAYSVSQRTQEIGIRVALGALPADVTRLILAGGARLIALGLLGGIAGALATTRLLSSLLFGTSPYDAVTFAGFSLVLGAVALFACWIPARRATRVSPLEAIRHH